MNIQELIKLQSELKTNLEKTENSISTMLLSYHKKLTDADFYKEYVFNQTGKTLEKMFFISIHSLPYQSHGDGDGIRIKFKVKSGKLNLIYTCTYTQDTPCLISIPLDLFDCDADVIKTTLQKQISESKENYRIRKEQQDKDRKKQDIANLKLQLKNLENTPI